VIVAGKFRRRQGEIEMTIIERSSGRKYQMVKIWDRNGDYQQASTGRRYRLVKRYV
jgi:hypothetical protein